MTLLKQIINSFHGRSFKIYHILANMQFKIIRKHIDPMSIILNTSGHDEHVPKIKLLYLYRQ